MYIMDSKIAEFREVLGHYPTGVCVITAFGTANSPSALVVGSFTSVSLSPPLVGFFPDRRSTSWPVIEQSGSFCVNVLGDDQLAVCRQLARSGVDKFAGIGFMASPYGLPVLDGALATIECQLHSVSEAGDHWFVLGQVRNLEVRRTGAPLVFHRGQYGTFLES